MEISTLLLWKYPWHPLSFRCSDGTDTFQRGYPSPCPLELNELLFINVIASSTFECDTIILFLNRAINPTFSTRRGKRIRKGIMKNRSRERRFGNIFTISLFRASPLSSFRAAPRGEGCALLFILLFFGKNRGHAPPQFLRLG